MIGDLNGYARFAIGLPRFLRQRLTPVEARCHVEARLKEREPNFLRLVRRGIFGYPRSPYLPLMKRAGCEFGDLERMVGSRGLEPTLAALREAGVYATFEEFKGRQPIVRGGEVIAVSPQFDNPLLSRYYAAETSGTTGPATRILFDLEHMATTAALRGLAWEAHGLLDAPTPIWRSILPGVSGVYDILRGARLGNVPQRWFTPVSPGDLRPSLQCRLATAYLVGMGRACGVRIPRPERVPLDEACVIARWMARTLEREGRCVVSAFVSLAMRVALAAEAERLNLTGATFTGGGEPPTPAKVGAITRSGARWVPTYAFAEGGLIGIGCANPMDGNDVHFFRDSLALIQYSQQVPGGQNPVDAFCFTSLLPSAPKLLLNVETDDYGVIDRKRCGCPLEAVGFVDHIRHVRSFRKLTGEGVTLVGSDMVRILEEELPARFGGTALDYQFLEEEDERGFTRLVLLVSPRVPMADEHSIVRTILDCLARGAPSVDLARAIWSQAGTLQVRRAEPVWTSRGKLMPLHIARGGAPRPAAAPFPVDEP